MFPLTFKENETWLWIFSNLASTLASMRDRPSGQELRRKKLFFSYAWQTQQRTSLQGFLRKLKELLTLAGAKDIFLDTDNMGGGLVHTMQSKLNESDRVLVFLTEGYRRASTITGRGVQVEYDHIEHIRGNKPANFVIPICCGGGFGELIPGNHWYAGQLVYNFCTEDNFCKTFFRLLNDLQPSDELSRSQETTFLLKWEAYKNQNVPPVPDPRRATICTNSTAVFVTTDPADSFSLVLTPSDVLSAAVTVTLVIPPQLDISPKVITFQPGAPVDKTITIKGRGRGEERTLSFSVSSDDWKYDAVSIQPVDVTVYPKGVISLSSPSISIYTGEQTTVRLSATSAPMHDVILRPTISSATLSGPASVTIAAWQGEHAVLADWGVDVALVAGASAEKLSISWVSSSRDMWFDDLRVVIPVTVLVRPPGAPAPGGGAVSPSLAGRAAASLSRAYGGGAVASSSLADRAAASLSRVYAQARAPAPTGHAPSTAAQPAPPGGGAVASPSLAGRAASRLSKVWAQARAPAPAGDGTFAWDPATAIGGQVLTWEDENRTITTTHSNWAHVFGNAVYDRGQVSWSLQFSTGRQLDVFVGVAGEAFRERASRNRRPYSTDHARVLNCREGTICMGPKEGDNPYCESLKQGDVLTVILDCDQGTLAFCRNGKNMGVAFEADDICRGPVRPVVCLKAGSMSRQEQKRLNRVTLMPFA